MHLTGGRQPTREGCLLEVSSSMTFWKRQSYGDSEKVRGGQRLGVGRVTRQNPQRFRD